jgi:hypothetical protein
MSTTLDVTGPSCYRLLFDGQVPICVATCRSTSPRKSVSSRCDHLNVFAAAGAACLMREKRQVVEDVIACSYCRATSAFADTHDLFNAEQRVLAVATHNSFENDRVALAPVHVFHTTQPRRRIVLPSGVPFIVSLLVNNQSMIVRSVQSLSHIRSRLL